jgi:hypothetical protein
MPMCAIPVPAMHEDVHHGACEEKQPRQNSQHVRAVFSEKQGSGHNQKRQENPAGPARGVVVMV